MGGVCREKLRGLGSSHLVCGVKGFYRGYLWEHISSPKERSRWRLGWSKEAIHSQHLGNQGTLPL